jgi:two-component system response regulator DevR
LNASAPHRRVFIAEDAPAVRARLAKLAQEVDGTVLVGEAETAEAAIEGILRTQPDCAILDFHLRGGTGLQVLRQIRAAGCECLVIVLTNYPEAAYRAACMAAGAGWFFDKSSEFGKVQAALAGVTARSSGRD